MPRRFCVPRTHCPAHLCRRFLRKGQELYDSLAVYFCYDCNQPVFEPRLRSTFHVLISRAFSLLLRKSVVLSWLGVRVNLCCFSKRGGVMVFVLHTGFINISIMIPCSFILPSPITITEVDFFDRFRSDFAVLCLIPIGAFWWKRDTWGF